MTTANLSRRHPADRYRPKPVRRAAGASHLVQFYESDVFLTDAVAEYVGAGLDMGASAIIVATPSHRAAVAAQLRAQSIDVDAAVECGRFVALDAAETLAQFMRDGAPDSERFAAVIGRLVERTAAGRNDLRAFGEMVALLVAQGNPAAALQLEDLWNGLQRRLPFSLLCAYPIGDFNDEAHSLLLTSVCDVHTHVVPAESFTEIAGAEAQRRSIAALQQKAAWLEAQIQERERAQAQLQEALAAERAAHAAAEAAARARVDFLSIASHELRTPLTSLLGYAQAMLRRLQRGGQLTPDQVERLLTLVAGRGEWLARLLNQLLDFSNMEAGTLVLDREVTDVAALVREIVVEAGGWSGRHQVLLTAPLSLPAAVDFERLRRILLALLDNAVRYSPNGGAVDVTLRSLPPAELQISVRDHGLGIPAEQRPRLFQPFFQAHRDDHRSGVGLGLYLSRRIIEMHGGRLDARFPSDGGVCIDLRMPTAEDESAP